MFSKSLPHNFYDTFCVVLDMLSQWPPGTSYREGSSGELILENEVLICRHADVILGYETTGFHTKYCLVLSFKFRKTEF